MKRKHKADKAPRPVQDRPTNLRIDGPTHDAADRASKLTGLKKTDVLRHAIRFGIPVVMERMAQP